MAHTHDLLGCRLTLVDTGSIPRGRNEREREREKERKRERERERERICDEVQSSCVVIRWGNQGIVLAYLRIAGSVIVYTGGEHYVHQTTVHDYGPAATHYLRPLPQSNRVAHVNYRDMRAGCGNT